MSEEPEIKEPRWSVINKVYDELDKALTEAITKEELIFIEINIIMMMLREKVDENKLQAFLMYLNDESTSKTSDMYR